MSLYQDALDIMNCAISDAKPDAAVLRAIREIDFSRGRIIVIAVGKAAWQMANAAYGALGSRIERGVVITKYGHSRGPVGKLTVYEAGHPVPDENGFAATEAAIRCVSGLHAEDTVLFLLSGGGSALFEKPLIPPEDLAQLTKELLSCGADIVETNTIRKRLSAVKGGRFAQLCMPAQVKSIVLSDIIGDPLDMIASGPAYPDSSSCREAFAVAEKYNLTLSAQIRNLLAVETCKRLENVETFITGSVRQLCASAERKCRELGYDPIVLTSELSCTARDAGVFFGNIARTHYGQNRKTAYIAGGETVVRITGNGKGGRNQELALAAAPYLSGLDGAAVFSFGSDGTDGPTDAAGGFVDGTTNEKLAELGLDVHQCLQNNDSYHALQSCGGLLITGPTGTNVNDLSVLLLGK